MNFRSDASALPDETNTKKEKGKHAYDIIIAVLFLAIVVIITTRALKRTKDMFTDIKR